jgi:hypothetical protein
MKPILNFESGVLFPKAKEGAIARPAPAMAVVLMNSRLFIPMIV